MFVISGRVGSFEQGLKVDSSRSNVQCIKCRSERWYGVWGFDVY